MGDILTAEQDLAAGHSVAGIAHQGAHKGGLTGAIMAHQNMGLTGVHRQVQSIKKDLLLLPDDDL